jgi:hypothetical protein
VRQYSVHDPPVGNSQSILHRPWFCFGERLLDWLRRHDKWYGNISASLIRFCTPFFNDTFMEEADDLCDRVAIMIRKDRNLAPTDLKNHWKRESLLDDVFIHFTGSR